MEGGVDAFELARLLRRRNPAPYAGLLDFGEVALVSSSPERFLGVRDRVIEARPIKGTIARGASPEEDAQAAAVLANNPKDRSENLMITDLLRNDLGRVCTPGSVHVPEMFAVESFATVHQLVSTVRGCLRDEVSPMEAVQACFPGGSMTGAPKVRSMALLETLEAGPRGLYSGAFGYLGAGGDLNLAMTIRSAVVTANAVRIGAGGAVVSLSDPEAEVAEMRLKLRPVLEAVAVAKAAPSDQVA